VPLTKPRHSATVNQGVGGGSLRHQKVCWRQGSGATRSAAAKRWPASSNAPWRGTSAPARRRSKVDLPQPLAPCTHVTPAPACAEKPSNSQRWP